MMVRPMRVCAGIVSTAVQSEADAVQRNGTLLHAEVAQTGGQTKFDPEGLAIAA